MSLGLFYPPEQVVNDAPKVFASRILARLATRLRVTSLHFLQGDTSGSMDAQFFPAAAMALRVSVQKDCIPNLSHRPQSMPRYDVEASTASSPNRNPLVG